MVVKLTKFLFAPLIGILITVGLALGLSQNLKLAKYKDAFGKVDAIKQVDVDEKVSSKVITHTHALYQDKVIGSKYELSDTNFYGSAHLEIFVTEDEAILKIINIINYSQSRGQENLLTQIEKIRNIPLKDATIPDIAGASMGSSLINSLIAEVKAYHLEVDPYDTLYGAGYQLKEDENFTATDKVIDRSMVLDGSTVEVGVVYTLKVAGQYNDGGSEGSITFKVAFKDNVIGFYEFIEYNHTVGFRLKVVEMLDTMIGQTIGEAAKYEVASGAGSTLSKNIVLSGIKALALIYQGTALTEFEGVYGKGYTSVIDSSFTPTDKVASRETIFDQLGVLAGVVYEIHARGLYNDYSEKIGTISIQMAFKEDLIKAYGFGVYEHSVTNTYKDSVVKYLDDLIGKDIDGAADFGTGSGATNSKNLIKKAIIELKGVYANENQ